MMDIHEIRAKAKVLEDTIWNLVYEFEKETDVQVKDLVVTRIGAMETRRRCNLHRIYADIKLW